MGIRKYFGRSARAVATRLSYANVMATMAVFIAAGGTGYAVTRINGSQIKNRSIPGNKLKLGAVTAREITPKLANNLSKLHVTNARLGRRPGARAAAATASSGSLVGLHVGQTVRLIQAAPFTTTATCTDEGNGLFKVELDATSSEAGWWGGDTAPPSDSGGPPPRPDAFGPHPAGVRARLFSYQSSSPTLAGGFGSQTLAAPSGASVSFGFYTLGVHLLGSDCVVGMYAIG